MSNFAVDSISAFEACCECGGGSKKMIAVSIHESTQHEHARSFQTVGPQHPDNKQHLLARLPEGTEIVGRGGSFKIRVKMGPFPGSSDADLTSLANGVTDEKMGTVLLRGNSRTPGHFGTELVGDPTRTDLVTVAWHNNPTVIGTEVHWTGTVKVHETAPVGHFFMRVGQTTVEDFYAEIPVAVLFNPHSQASPEYLQSSSAGGCSDKPSSWTDSDGFSCQVYETKFWCTTGGAPGPSWKASWGTLKKYGTNGIDATMACCKCGGGFSSGGQNIAREYIFGAQAVVFQSIHVTNRQQTASQSSASFQAPSGVLWTFDHFQKSTLAVALHLIRKLDWKKRESVATVSRELTNAIGADLCRGKWGTYPDDLSELGCKSTFPDDCKRPWIWKRTADILETYWAQWVTTKGNARGAWFCQCWVFSAISTTIFRALGIPARSVTNFQSAHDKNYDRAIAQFYWRKPGETKRYRLDDGELGCPSSCNTAQCKSSCHYEVQSGLGFGRKPECETCMRCVTCSWAQGGESIWNFHVWNEVWFSRLEHDKRWIQVGYPASGAGPNDGALVPGWSAVDATPQEFSNGRYQMGPAFMPDVLAGHESCSDTGFVIGETNSAIKQYVIEAPSKDEVKAGGGTMYTNPYGDPLYPLSTYWHKGQHAKAVLHEINVGESFVGEATLSQKPGGLSTHCAQYSSSQTDACLDSTLDLTSTYKTYEPSGPFPSLETMSYQSLITMTHDAMKLSQKQNECRHKTIDSLAEEGSAGTVNASRAGSIVREWQDYDITADTSFSGRFPLTPLPLVDDIPSWAESQSLAQLFDTDGSSTNALYQQDQEVLVFSSIALGDATTYTVQPTTDLGVSIQVQNIDTTTAWPISMTWSVHIQSNTGATLATKIPLASGCWNGNTMITNAVSTSNCWDMDTTDMIGAGQTQTISWTLQGAAHLSCASLRALTTTADGPINEQFFLRVDFSVAVTGSSETHNQEALLQFASGMDLDQCISTGYWNR
jgi:hypothetical protein